VSPELRRFPFLKCWRENCTAVEMGMGDIMDPKLAMLVMLFGSIIGLSYLSADTMARFKRWRKNAPANR
jgi:hypothetical protein